MVAETAPPPPRRPAPDAGPARRSRAPFVVGLVLVLGGLGLLGWYVWEMYGTTYVSQQRHGQVVDELERDWEAGRRTAEVDGVDGGDGAPAQAGAVIRIPRFGEDYAVPVLEGVGLDVLAAGFGHFTESAEPGQRGNYAIAGHRVTHGEPLRRMPELQPGDEVIVDTATTTYTYRLTNGGDDLVVPMEDYWVVDKLPTNPVEGGIEPRQRPGQRLLTLTTCASVFATTDRMVAFGVLVDSRPREPATAASAPLPATPR